MGTSASRREILRAALALGAALPALAPSRILARSADDDYVMRHVQPDLRQSARAIFKEAETTSPLGTGTLEAWRARMVGGGVVPLPEVPVERRRIPGLAGQPDVTIHVINAKPGQSRPGILHTHGGGFVLGTAEGDNLWLQQLCRKIDCTIVNVDYRLAPETTWRGSVEDNYAGLKWLHANAASLGVDPKRLAVMGESAGGGHAALLAIAARDRGEVPLAFQCLIYPMLDDRTGSTRTVPSHLGRLIWTARDNRFGWAGFLGMEPGGSEVPAAAVPARVENLAGLPPTFIGLGGLDLFLDEDIDYAQRLIAAGVPTELLVIPGAYHAFDGDPKAVTASRFNAAKVDALRRALEITPK